MDSPLEQGLPHRKRLYRTLNSVKKLQIDFCGDFRAIRRKQACFLMTHTHIYSVSAKPFWRDNGSMKFKLAHFTCTVCAHWATLLRLYYINTNDNIATPYYNAVKPRARQPRNGKTAPCYVVFTPKSVPSVDRDDSDIDETTSSSSECSTRSADVSCITGQSFTHGC